MRRKLLAAVLVVVAAVSVLAQSHRVQQFAFVQYDKATFQLKRQDYSKAARLMASQLGTAPALPHLVELPRPYAALSDGGRVVLSRQVDDSAQGTGYRQVEFYRRHGNRGAIYFFMPDPHSVPPQSAVPIASGWFLTES